jgi:flagellar basal-body rod protein FlgG
LSQRRHSDTVPATPLAFFHGQEFHRLVRFRREAAMATIKRAGASSLALILAAGGLLGIHQLLHVARGQNGKPAAKHELSLKATAGTKKRSGDGPFGTPAGPPKETAEAPAFYLASDFDSASVGEILPTSGQTAPAPAPAPMPAPANAVPLPPSSEDWPLPTPSAKRDASPESGNESNPRRKSSGRRIIDRELPNTSSEERDLWHEQTKDLSLNDLRELMRIRAQVGRLSVPNREGNGTAGQPLLVPPGSPGIGDGPFYPPANEGDGPSTGEPDPGRILGETMTALTRARHVILNNIANARTNAYKRRLISFESVLDRPMTSAMGDDPMHYSFAAPIEAGARLAPALVDMTPGKLVRTNRSMDLAIDGQGFFVVTDAKTGLEAFTRRGRFSTNASRKIVLTSAGREWVLTPPITVGADVSELEVGADGVVRTWNPNGRAIEQIGSIQTATFESQSILSPVDGTIFTKPPKTSAQISNPGSNGSAIIRQGFLEESNVDVKQELDELTRLASQVQSLEQAARSMQSAGSESPLR